MKAAGMITNQYCLTDFKAKLLMLALSECSTAMLKWPFDLAIDGQSKEGQEGIST